jgi:DNA-directed RNA polymerase subunit H
MKKSFGHELVPQHLKLSEKEKEAFLKENNFTARNLPKVLKDDSAVKELNPKAGDLIKITRPSKTAGESVYYRIVVEE